MSTFSPWSLACGCDVMPTKASQPPLSCTSIVLPGVSNGIAALVATTPPRSSGPHPIYPSTRKTRLESTTTTSINLPAPLKFMKNSSE
jgi:hypothetical protein